MKCNTSIVHIITPEHTKQNAGIQEQTNGAATVIVVLFSLSEGQMWPICSSHTNV